MDWTATLHDPRYATIGVAAVLTLDDTAGTTFDITVIDKTAGVEVPDRTKIETTVPAVKVRAVELDDNGLSRTDLPGSSITVNGSTYRINAARPKPSPGGEADGEYLLLLSAI